MTPETPPINPGQPGQKAPSYPQHGSPAALENLLGTESTTGKFTDERWRVLEMLGTDQFQNPPFPHIREALVDGRLSEAKIIELRKDGNGELLFSGKERLLPDRHSLIVMTGELTARNSVVEHTFGEGYPIFAASRFADTSEIEPKTPAVSLLAVPRAELEKLYLNDQSFCAAFDRSIRAAHPNLAMPEHIRERIRRTRAQNILAIVTREGIGAVTGNDGILAVLNPGKHSVQSPFEPRSSADRIPVNQQTWAIIKGISTLAAYLSRDELLSLARDSRNAAQNLKFPENETASLALHIFRLNVARRENELLSQKFPLILQALRESPFTDKDRSSMLGRLLELTWLQEKRSGIKDRHAMWDRAVARLFAQAVKSSNGALPLVREKLDKRIEKSFNILKKRGEPGILSIAIERLPAVMALQPSSVRELQGNHPSWLALKDLRERLENGEVSAVGGSTYASMRFPVEMLDTLAAGQAKVVVFNGSHADGVQYVRRKFGTCVTNSDVLEPCDVVNLQGAYGSFSRSWVFFRDGTSVALISHIGRSRQLSNAGALMLYRDIDDSRLPLDDMTLADCCTNLQSAVKEGLKDVLSASTKDFEGRSLFDETIKNAASYPTQVAILLYPKQLLESLSHRMVLKSFSHPVLGPVQVGFIKQNDGQLVRLVIPTVGGAGLYGDTAGMFVESLFDKTVIRRLIPHILFSATAGGFAGTDELPYFSGSDTRGLPASHPEGFLMPNDRIFDDAGEMEMRTLLKAAKSSEKFQKELKKLNTLLEEAKVQRYSRHFCISHPGDETYEKIEKLVHTHLVSSVDVEAGPIQRALLRVKKICPAATFTPIYNYSDDPRSGKANRFHSLAYGGPLHDNWKPDLKLNPVMEGLIELAYALYKG